MLFTNTRTSIGNLFLLRLTCIDGLGSGADALSTLLLLHIFGFRFWFINTSWSGAVVEVWALIPTNLRNGAWEINIVFLVSNRNSFTRALVILRNVLSYRWRSVALLRIILLWGSSTAGSIFKFILINTRCTIFGTQVFLGSIHS